MSLARRLLTLVAGAVLITAAAPVAAQLDQLRAVARTHGIALVLIGLGSNNSQFTFGDAVLGRCLTGAATTATRAVSCVRAADGAITVRAG